MKKISKTVLFFGNERLATGVSTTAPTLRALIDNDYRVSAVISSYEPGISRDNRALEIAQVAGDNNIPLIFPKNSSETLAAVRANPAVIGVLVAYGKIIPQTLIDLFPLGIINIHPSLLPLHRGSTPIESVILDGSKSTGVSLMKLTDKMDAGPLYAQQELSLSSNETKQQLADSLLNLGSSLLIKHLPLIISKKALLVIQDESQASYDSFIKKGDGRIDWQKPAAKLEREIRAYATWPKSWSKIGNIDVIITKVTEVNNPAVVNKSGKITIDQNEIIVGCGNGALRIDQLKPAGKPEMSGQAFIAGYGNRLTD